MRTLFFSPKKVMVGMIDSVVTAARFFMSVKMLSSSCTRGRLRSWIDRRNRLLSIEIIKTESTNVFVETRFDLFVVIYLFLVLFIDYFLVLEVSQNF